ncbi:hypothetical protein [Gardnerella vaginalis]|uniref:hypothetical protein n=1 Tax=Gardnerella vaginalis TaxID=2702 RepID=UPI0039EFD199
MSDFNDGVDDYQGKNQMNGVAGNNNSSSGASGNAGYSQNGQLYGQTYGQSYSQPYDQSAQHHDQQMRQQPQFASSYGQPVQPQMNPQQMGQQFGQQQFVQPQFAQPRMSQLPPYGQPPMGRPYGRPAYGGVPMGRPYGGAPFAARAGYANGRFNSSYIERQARKFSFRWNAKEIISAIIVVVIAVIFAFVFNYYHSEISSFFDSRVQEVLSIDFFLENRRLIWYIEDDIFSCIFPLAIMLSFAQVLRKRFFTIACGLVVFVTDFLTFATYEILNSSHLEHIDIVVRIYFRDFFWQRSSIVIFMILVELLQWVMTKYKAASFWKYILINFIAAVIGYIYYLVVTILGIHNAYLNLPDLFSEYFLIEAEGFFIVAIPVLIILPCLVSLLLKAVKFTKFLNPEREMMHL